MRPVEQIRPLNREKYANNNESNNLGLTTRLCSMIMIMISVRMFGNIKVYPCILPNYIEQKMAGLKYFFHHVLKLFLHHLKTQIYNKLY